MDIMYVRILRLLLIAGWLGGAFARAEIAENLSEEKKPLYELGIGGGSGYFVHYPASDQGKWRSILVPTILYRGAIFRADEEDGVRALIVSDPRYGIELSGAGTLPVRSTENTARKGMPDLDLLGEIGPQVYFKTHKDDAFETRLFFPLRTVASTDFSKIRPRGYTFAPGFDVRMLLPKSLGAIQFKVSALFGSKQYQEYFYGVADKYVGPARNAYEASGGYVGTGTEISYSGNWKKVSFFFQLGHNNHQGAKNAESPLFKREQTYSGFCGIGWTLYHSDAKEEERP